MITLAWGGMWENTLGAAPFPCESFPSELAITQQLAGVRERACLWPQPQKAWGLPLYVQGCVTLGATCTILSLSPLGKQCRECLCCVQPPRLNIKVGPTLEQRDLWFFSL